MRGARISVVGRLLGSAYDSSLIELGNLLHRSVIDETVHFDFVELVLCFGPRFFRRVSFEVEHAKGDTLCLKLILMILVTLEKEHFDFWWKKRFFR